MNFLSFSSVFFSNTHKSILRTLTGCLTNFTHFFDSIRSHRIRARSHKTSPLQMTHPSPACYLSFWPCVCVCVCVHAQSSPSLWCPVDCSPPGSSVHGISQAGILEWAAISSSLPDPGIQPGLLHLLHQQADSLPMRRLGSRVSDQLAIHWRFPWLSSWVWLIC